MCCVVSVVVVCLSCLLSGGVGDFQMDIFTQLANKHAMSEEAVRHIARDLFGIDLRYLDEDEAKRLSRKIRSIKDDQP